MVCYSPLSIRRPNGNGSGDRITVPCGKCFACLQKKRGEWSIRLKHELKYHTKATFLTMTYNDDNVPIKQSEDKFTLTVCKEDVQLFLKRLRKKLKNEIKYYLVSEYGGTTYRPHYHAIIYGLSYHDHQVIYDAWKKGNIKLGTVTDASIHYVTGYLISKDSTPDGAERVFSLMSKGLGKKHIEENRDHYGKLNQVYVKTENGIIHSMPRYYREKLFTKETLEHNSELVRKMLKEKPSADQIQAYIKKQKQYKKNRI